MSLSINTNRVDVAKQVETEFAQEAVQEENGDARAESRFILMKGNLHGTLSKLGLQEGQKSIAPCDEQTCCDLQCYFKICDADCPCKA